LTGTQPKEHSSVGRLEEPFKTDKATKELINGFINQLVKLKIDLSST